MSDQELTVQNINEMYRYESMIAIAQKALIHAQQAMDQIQDLTSKPTSKGVSTCYLLKGQALMFTKAVLSVLELA